MIGLIDMLANFWHLLSATTSKTKSPIVHWNHVYMNSNSTFDIRLNRDTKSFQLQQNVVIFYWLQNAIWTFES